MRGGLTVRPASVLVLVLVLVLRLVSVSGSVPKVSGFAAGFFQQAHILNVHAAVDRLAHVVNRQEAHANCGERLHLDAGATEGFDGHGKLYAAARFVEGEIRSDTRDGQGVAKWDQIRCALRRLNCSQARDSDDIAFFAGTAAYQGKGSGEHPDDAAGTRNAMCLGLGANINHMSLTVLVEMGERS